MLDYIYFGGHLQTLNKNRNSSILSFLCLPGMPCLSPRCDFGVHSIGTVGPLSGASFASLQSKSLLYPPEWSWQARRCWGFGLPLPDAEDTACFFPPSPGLPAPGVARSCWIYCISLNRSPLWLTRTLIMQPALPDLVFSRSHHHFCVLWNWTAFYPRGLAWSPSCFMSSLSTQIDLCRCSVTARGSRDPKVYWKGNVSTLPNSSAVLHTDILISTAPLGQLVGSGCFHLLGA